MDDYLADASCSVQVGRTLVESSPGRLATQPSASDEIIFCRSVQAADGSTKEVPIWWFERSRVFDSSGENETQAVRQLYTHEAQSYLVESMPYSFFEKALFPVVLDYITKYGSIPSSETWGPPDTYYISGSVTVTGSGTMLTIRPGTTVKYENGVSAYLKVQSGACIKAEGTAYNYITLTSKKDDSSGEDLTPSSSTSGSRADYRVAVELASTASDSSVVKYCKIGYPFYGILNYINSDNLAAFENNIISHGRYAIYLDQPADVKNNLMTDCDLRGIYTYGYGEPSYTGWITNNTIDGAFYGIWCYRQTLVAKYNIFSRCTYGVKRHAGTITLDYNAYWKNTLYDVYGCTKGPNDVTFGDAYDPYDSSALGDFYLNDFDGAGGELKDKPCDPEFGFPKYAYTTQEPEVAAASITTPTTWDMVDCETSPTTVDIGYHHNRVDRYLPYDCIVSGSQASLTISPGVVVAMYGSCSFLYIYVYSGARLTCVGDPLDKGYNVVANSKSLSALIESPQVSASNPLFIVGSDASPQTAIEHTEMMWLAYGLALQGGVPAEVKNSVFLLNYYGIYEGSASNRGCFNNLFYCNEYGACQSGGHHTVTNCTFDANGKGIYSYVPSGSSLTVKDSLFTENDYGIYLYGTGGQLEEAYDAFWGNGELIEGGELGPTSQLLLLRTL